MKIATWNVNSLKVRLQHLLDWLAAHQPDAICLQETKLEDANFPKAMLAEAGYDAVFCGHKTFNGVAIVARAPIADIISGIDGLEDTLRSVC
jgi:exodeoxyribonuclease-3